MKETKNKEAEQEKVEFQLGSSVVSASDIPITQLGFLCAV